MSVVFSGLKVHVMFIFLTIQWNCLLLVTSIRAFVPLKRLFKAESFDDAILMS